MTRLLLIFLLCLPVSAQTACLIVPYSATALTKMHDPATVDKMPRLVLFGNPAIERAGVTGRRMAFCHPWDQDDSKAVSTWTWIKNKLTALSVSYSVRLTGDLPADWRYPAVAP